MTKSAFEGKVNNQGRNKEILRITLILDYIYRLLYLERNIFAKKCVKMGLQGFNGGLYLQAWIGKQVKMEKNQLLFNSLICLSNGDRASRSNQIEGPKHSNIFDIYFTSFKKM